MVSIVHIVDDDASFRTATGRLLRLRGYEVAEYGSADEFLERLPGSIQAGCILLDVGMPGLSGPDLQRRLRELGVPFPIVFLTGRGDIPTTVRAMKAGADDFLTKPISAEILLDSIEHAISRYDAGCIQNQWLCNARASLAKLTPREREVFEFVVGGKLNKQTAFALGITERTVKAHRQRIFKKLDVGSLAELVSLAERTEILSAVRTADNPHSEPGEEISRQRASEAEAPEETPE